MLLNGFDNQYDKNNTITVPIKSYNRVIKPFMYPKMAIIRKNMINKISKIVEFKIKSSFDSTIL